MITPEVRAPAQAAAEMRRVPGEEDSEGVEEWGAEEDAGKAEGVGKAGGQDAFGESFLCQRGLSS